MPFTAPVPKRVLISDMATGKVSVLLDASLSERHTHTNDVTEFPVEEGANVTDHVRPRSRPLHIEGMLSDFQVGNGKGQGATAAVRLQRGTGLVDSIRAGIQNFGVSLPFLSDLPPEVIVTEGSDGRNLDDAANLLYAQLEDFADKGTLLKVETAFRTYTNMVIEDLDAPRDSTTKRAVKFTVRLKQIRLVSSETVSVKASKIAQAKLGKQTPPAASDAQQEQSWLVQAAQGKLGPFGQDIAKGILPDATYQAFQSSAMNPLTNAVVK